MILTLKARFAANPAACRRSALSFAGPIRFGRGTAVPLRTALVSTTCLFFLDRLRVDGSSSTELREEGGWRVPAERSIRRVDGGRRFRFA